MPEALYHKGNLSITTMKAPIMTIIPRLI